MKISIASSPFFHWGFNGEFLFSSTIRKGFTCSGNQLLQCFAECDPLSSCKLWKKSVRQVGKCYHFICCLLHFKMSKELLGRRWLSSQQHVTKWHMLFTLMETSLSFLFHISPSSDKKQIVQGNHMSHFHQDSPILNASSGCPIGWVK